METVSSDGLLELHSSDEFPGGFLTTWGELESGQEGEGTEKLEMVLPGRRLDQMDGDDDSTEILDKKRRTSARQ